MTERSRRGADGDDTPLLATAYATGEPGSFPPARSIARALPVDHGRRILLAVAAGVGDPPSAEAQALEALGRIEAVVARADAAAPIHDILQAGFVAADEGIARLKSLPGSAQHAGVVAVAAIVDGLTATFATLGTPAALLRRGGSVRRLTAPAVRGKRALGMGGPVAPEFTGPIDLAPGDSLLLCTQTVTRGLGEQVIEAVFEEFGPEQAAQDLADLAAQQPGSDGAAVAVLHVPSGAAVPPPPVVAAIPAAAAAAARDLTEPLPPPPPPQRPRTATPSWLTWLLLGAAIVVGALAVVAIVRWQGGFGSSSNKPATEVVSAPGVPIVLTPTVAATQRTPAATVPVVANTPLPAIARTPGRSPTPAAQATTPTPVATLPPLASLPACDSSNATPCRYTAQAGDSMSLIGDRFDLTAACFVAANRDHTGVPVTPPTPTIALGEEYYIPSPAQCAVLAAASSTPASGASATAQPTPAASPTPAPACTPYPGATAPPPGCSAG